MIGRPDPSEHDAYYRTYITLVPEGDVVATLRAGIDETRGLLGALSAAQAAHRYAPGKWSVKEVVAHLADSERTFAFRAFWFARGGPGELGPFDQEPFVAESGAGHRSLPDLLDELAAIRASTIALFASLDPSVLMRTGIASGYRFTVRTFPYIVAGHEMHHRRILRERYLSDPATSSSPDVEARQD